MGKATRSRMARVGGAAARAAAGEVGKRSRRPGRRGKGAARAGVGGRHHGAYPTAGRGGETLRWLGGESPGRRRGGSRGGGSSGVEEAGRRLGKVEGVVEMLSWRRIDRGCPEGAAASGKAASAGGEGNRSCGELRRGFSDYFGEVVARAQKHTVTRSPWPEMARRRVAACGRWAEEEDRGKGRGGGDLRTGGGRRGSRERGGRRGSYLLTGRPGASYGVGKMGDGEVAAGKAQSEVMALSEAGVAAVQKGGRETWSAHSH